MEVQYSLWGDVYVGCLHTEPAFACPGDPGFQVQADNSLSAWKTTADEHKSTMAMVNREHVSWNHLRENCS